MRRKLFGPVAAVIPVKDEEAAIAVANDSVSVLAALSSRAIANAVSALHANASRAVSVFVNESCIRCPLPSVA